MENGTEWKRISYLALGDSYTIGEKVDSSQRWPVQLAEKITNLGLEIRAPEIIAVTGWTTDELLEGIGASGIKGTYGLVSLLIGVNNQYRGLSAEEFRKEFRKLLDVSLRFAAGREKRVIVLSIPDWGVMPFARGRDRKKIADEIDRFNEIKRQETEKKGVRFFNITDISRRADTDPSLIASDGLHPSGKMYRLWVEKIAAETMETLRREINEE